MFNKTKLFTLGIMLFIFVGVSFGTYTNTSSEWLAVEAYNHNFHAILQDDGGVGMTWAAFALPQGHYFKYWKVMRSQTNPNPVYRVDPYIKYDGNIGFTQYKDNSPKAGVNYYRVCAVTSASDGYHRFCSNNVDEISLGTSVVTNSTSAVMSNPKITSNLSSALKKAVDSMIEKLLKNLENKFGDDRNAKVSVLETLSDKISNIKVNYRLQPMINYLVEKLDETIALLQIESLLDID